MEVCFTSVNNVHTNCSFLAMVAFYIMYGMFEI